MGILGRYMKTGLKGCVCVAPDGIVARVDGFVHGKVKLIGQWYRVERCAVLADESLIDVMPAVLRGLGWDAREVPIIMNEVRDLVHCPKQMRLFDDD
jgi:hypothetical protein